MQVWWKIRSRAEHARWPGKIYSQGSVSNSGQEVSKPMNLYVLKCLAPQTACRGAIGSESTKFKLDIWEARLTHGCISIVEPST
jgi:hypothetical protein